MRTGDTTASERAAMLRTPPHILVTTPESLYLLLTSRTQPPHAANGANRHRRRDPRRHRHAARSAPGAVARAPASMLRSGRCSRIGLSATQKPIDEVARYLVGTAAEPCAIVDAGHRRDMDLGIEVPGSPLEAVMAHEVWDEYHDRLADADQDAPHDAGLRQHAAHGGAARAALERTARRRRRHRASRQPVEGDAARRRAPA